MPNLTAQLEKVLQDHFGYPHFRPGQLEIITALVSGRDVLAILPTGGGKSLCFQIPGLFLGGTTLVISPLISLMQDQVANLEKHDLKATFINSTLTAAQQRERLEAFVRGEYQFVYLAPEKLASKSFQAQCRQAPIRLVAIDEAHCVSVWGHDFRPEYLHIGTHLKAIFTDKRPPIIALTATANRLAQADIVRFCHLHHPYHAQKSFARDNLKLCVSACANEHQKIIRILHVLQKYHGQIGIIYVLTRKHAHQLAHLLNTLFQPHPPIKVYHGGLDKTERERIQNEFIAGTTPVIVATNAFGMGVDQSHVRFVIHAQISSNLENYFQEIGRAGRDGKIAHAYAFYTPADLEISARFITGNHSLSTLRRRLLIRKLHLVERFLRTHACRQRFILRTFDERRPGWRCGLCDNCSHYQFHFDATTVENFHRWQHWRNRLARRFDLLPNSILTDLTLGYLSVIPWKDLPDLTVIPGLGQGFLDRFGQYLPKR